MDIEIKEEKKEYCTRCHKCMTFKGGGNFPAIKFSVLWTLPPDKAFAEKQLGKYATGLEEWMFCWECCLDALCQPGDEGFVFRRLKHDAENANEGR